MAVNCVGVVSLSFCLRGLGHFPFACDIQRSQRAFLLFFPCAGVRKDLMWPFLPPVFVVFFGPGFGRTSRGRSSPLLVCCSDFALSSSLEKVSCQCSHCICGEFVAVWVLPVSLCLFEWISTRLFFLYAPVDGFNVALFLEV